MTDPATPSERPADGSDPDVEALADLFMDLRLDGPAAEGWTYQQTARHYARVILGRWLAGIRTATPSDPERRDHEWCVPHDHVQPDPERRSDHEHRPVIREGIPATNAWCEVCGFFPLPIEGARVLAAIPQDATPGLVLVREGSGGVFPDGTTNHPPIDFTQPPIPQDATPAGLDVERVRRAFWLIQSWPPDRDSAEVFAEAYLAATDPEAEG